MHRDHAEIPLAVTVTVPARLHLGFLDPGGVSGRRFGSVGLAVDAFRTRVTIKTARHDRLDGFERERAAIHLAAMRRVLGEEGGRHLQVEEAVPAHIGLGSGTQLALAVAAGLRRLQGLGLDARGDAIRLGRGARSGIGIGLFETGGLIVDGGHGPQTTVAPVLVRLPFPDEWRIVLVLDPARRGTHGADERAAFAALPPLPAADAAQLCGLVLLHALPALAEHELGSFGAAIAEVQRRLGDYFAPVQGGRRFASLAVEAALGMLEREGAVGIGQSSWGPTGFAFAPSQAAAQRLTRIAAAHPAAQGLDIRICRALNHGAEIDASAAAAVEQ